ncbi:MAG TPA: restriction endonuclease subunit M/S [Ignavibacteria bacterium]|nr:restriction endonuclease subunit M/S [Ignavibacteria bacterium]
MLNVETKRRIDTARDILVGKVPDPKSQVEQITIALIYKFMDDMDNESIQLGGKKNFFTGEYEKYAWNKLLDPRMGGYEMLNLYAEAITKLNQSPNLPQLFRDIFKNAYLPYRDPETLKMFLKTINEFTYDHSERLGDAYEYLLSIMSSQGDAGQFRTPRHIIDFMVEIVAPQKNEIILDPACGTAGFLISAYKYILRENTSEKYKKQNGNNGNYRADLLSVEEKRNLLDKFKGYDISPDMVRLSLVNMYLHGFVKPKIWEYDTLTSEDKWNEYADVILANPPFMTPKGGIRPHKRFSVKSNRSEVLFVGYIAEHLTPNGRAAVIVPEGIIFQSANAYKSLRKVLVENCLYAVVSLPAGVFQPYSGVKTSILLMDKQMAKNTDSILFVKIENDGFDLGAQRKPIDKNDLPDALKVIKEYIAAVKSGKPKSFVAEKKPCSALLVKKEKIAENDEYNLIADRYRINEKIKHQKWPIVAIGDICELGRGRVISKNYIEKHKGIYPVYSSQTTDDGVFGKIDSYDFDGEYVTWTTDGANAGTVFYRNGKFNCTNVCGTLKAKTDKVSMKYLARVLNAVAYKYVIHVGNPKLMNNVMAKIPIPLPPIEVQKEIVAEIENYQKIIDGSKQIIDSWKPNIERYLRKELKNYLAEHPELKKELKDGWKMVRLGEVCSFEYGKSLPEKDRIFGPYPVMGSNGRTGFHNKYLIEGPAIVIGRKGSSGEVVWEEENCFPIDTTYYIKLDKNNKVNLRWFYFVLKSIDLTKLSGGAGIPGLNRNDAYKISVPLPPIEVQQRIVEEIHKDEEALEKVKLLKERAEKRIEEILSEVWGEGKED